MNAGPNRVTRRTTGALETMVTEPSWPLSWSNGHRLFGGDGPVSWLLHCDHEPG